MKILDAEGRGGGGGEGRAEGFDIRCIGEQYREEG